MENEWIKKIKNSIEQRQKEMIDFGHTILKYELDDSRSEKEGILVIKHYVGYPAILTDEIEVKL